MLTILHAISLKKFWHKVISDDTSNTPAPQRLYQTPGKKALHLQLHTTTLSIQDFGR